MVIDGFAHLSFRKAVHAGAQLQLVPVEKSRDPLRIGPVEVDCRSLFVEQKGKAALGPLMGVVMKEVRGSVDGKVVSELLKKEIDAALAHKKA